MGNNRASFWRVATLGILSATAFVCVSFLLIFIDPQIALNPLKPSRPTGTLVAQPIMAVPTFIFTAAPSPSWTAAPTPSPLPTRTDSTYFYQPVLQQCRHGEGIAIAGTVWIGTDPQEDVRVRVSGSSDKTVVAQDATHPQSDGSITYHIVLKANGSFGSSPATWYVWTADADGNPTSNPDFHITTNNLAANDGRACWYVTLDFAH